MFKNRNRYFQDKKKLILLIADVLLFIALLGIMYWSSSRDQIMAAELKSNTAEKVEEQQQIEEERLRLEAEEYQQRHDNVLATVEANIPGIICWGDSLTVGAGGDGTSYPAVLESKLEENICANYNNAIAEKIPVENVLKIPVINMGVGGESSITIAGRSGGIPYVVSQAFTIPAGIEEAVPISFTSSTGAAVAPLRQGNLGMDRVTIDGIEGVIELAQETPTSTEYSYVFRRLENGEGREIAAGTEIITTGAQNYKNYIPVIFIGQNEGWDNRPQILIEQQRAMISSQAQNNDRYIILGLTTGNATNRAELEAAMAAEYGDKYINLREYLSGNALADAGLPPSDADAAAMAVGSVPQSLLSEGVHFNVDGYKLIGNILYARMDALGYFNEVKEVTNLFAE